MDRARYLAMKGVTGRLMSEEDGGHQDVRACFAAGLLSDLFFLKCFVLPGLCLLFHLSFMHIHSFLLC